MNKKPYDFSPKILINSTDIHAFSFVSTSNEKNIIKLVAFQPIGYNSFNLALVDYDEEKDVYDDESTSNNGDMGRVLATTWAIMLHFLKTFPENTVCINGNTEIKKKLYTRLIANNLLFLQTNYDVFGFTNKGELEKFEIYKEYFMILIQPKN